MNDRIETVEEMKALGWGDRAEAFRDWMIRLDHLCIRLTGLSIRDLPDQDFASMFDDELTPKEALSDILEDEGFPL